VNPAEVAQIKAQLADLHGKSTKPYRPRVPTPGFVYFMQSEQGGPIKIGWARDPDHRCRELQVAHPYRLLVLARVAGSTKLEAGLHALLDEHRLSGEWFEDAPAVRAVVAAAVSDAGRAA
jgi:hypothetical protein